jgi:hypothetical protein
VAEVVTEGEDGVVDGAELGVFIMLIACCAVFVFRAGSPLKRVGCWRIVVVAIGLI